MIQLGITRVLFIGLSSLPRGANIATVGAKYVHWYLSAVPRQLEVGLDRPVHVDGLDWSWCAHANVELEKANASGEMTCFKSPVLQMPPNLCFNSGSQSRTELLESCILFRYHCNSRIVNR